MTLLYNVNNAYADKCKQRYKHLYNPLICVSLTGSQQPVYENPSALCENPQPNRSLPRPLTEMQDFKFTYDTKIM
ncbi:hypothetical protein J4Q44_G00383950 [Coregonus suidteri]|uniref:Uncharacterized protein n=1 Tax=Coregonus suidteri TaxID=861788 RepID=A0AAN8KR88_9TELE